MIPARYPAPYATAVFSEQAKFARWKRITDVYARLHISRSKDPQPVRDLLNAALVTTTPPTPKQVEEAEQVTGHDVVAFLKVYEGSLPSDVRSHIHRGLTSSDLVDNGHFMALAEHAEFMVELIQDLKRSLERWEGMNTVRAGRTHGQIGDLTSWNHQMYVHNSVLEQIQAAMGDEARSHLMKSPGPTGRSPLLYGVALDLAFQEGVTLVPSTQVIPRDYQLRWASVYLRLACELESLATLVRCGARSEIGELREGDWKKRVGSSSMPTKKNPIDCEKVCGLARVARGYFATLAENVTLWDDRDISNSSVERIAVVDLASVVEHMTFTMHQVMANLEVDHQKMHGNATNPATRTYLLQALAQKHFNIGPVEAGKLIREYLMDFHVIDELRMAEDGWNTAEIKQWMREVDSIWEGCFG